MPDCSPRFIPNHERTCHANVNVTGCRFVTVLTGVNQVDDMPRVGVPAAAAKAYGVAARDRLAGEKVLVYRNGEVPVETGAAVAHGQGVECDNLGRAIPLAAGARLGTVMADAAGPGGFAFISLELT